MLSPCTVLGPIVRRLSFVTATLVALYVVSLSAATNPIDSNRRSAYWSTAGATIASRSTQCGSTVTAYGSDGTPSSAATINTAITNCTAGQYVSLGAGHFYLNTVIKFSGKSNVTLRGQGSNSTFLHWQGSGSGDDAGANAINITPATLNYNDGPHNVCNWTAGYTQGTTVITIGTCSTGALSNLTVGSGIFLDQLTDSTTDNGQFWVAGGDNSFVGISCSSCARNVARTLRGQQFYTTVTAINGSNITIADPLLHPNWASGKTPQVWFAGSGATQADITGVGIENLSIDLTDLNINGNSGHQFGVFFGNADNCWFKGVRSIALHPQTGADDIRSQLRLYQSSHITTRDSYFFGKPGAAGNYGWETFGASNSLIENNIGENNSTAVTDNAAGSVFAYNYILNDAYVNPNWMQAAHYFHAVGNGFVLIEGNDSAGLILDIIHGSADFITAFRNRFHGWEHGKTTQTVAVHNYGYSRYTNIVGNVLGQSSYHGTYETAAGGSTTNCATSVYALGLGANCADGGSGGNPPNDSVVKTTMLRWGNYDTVNGVNRFNNGEVPSGEANYPNAIPADQTIVDSEYLSAQPSWWPTPWGTPHWPPIGPDVMSGDEANVGGHVYSIPAKLCRENSSLDTNYAESYTVTNASYSSGFVTLTTNQTQATTFSGTPTTTSGTVGADTGWAVGQYIYIQELSQPGSPIYRVKLSNVSGTTITWSQALPAAPAASDLANRIQPGTSGTAIQVSGITPSGYNGRMLVYDSSGSTIRYGLLTDPGAYSSGGTVQSPPILQFDPASCYSAAGAPTGNRYRPIIRRPGLPGGDE